MMKRIDVNKTIINIVKGFKYFSVFCICVAFTLLIEYGLEIDFILMLVLSSILLYSTDRKIKEETEDESNL